MTDYKASENEKEALEKYLLQFLNLEKRFPLLPGIKNPEAIANLIGIDESELDKLRNLFSENAKQAALELMNEEEISDSFDNLPFRENETIIAWRFHDG
jgi:hypothetical protein